MIIRKMHDASIQVKLLISYMLLIIVPSLLVLYLARTTMLDLVTGDTIDQSFALSKQSASALEAIINPLPTMGSVLQRNALIRQMCTGAASPEEKIRMSRDEAQLTELNSVLYNDIDRSLVTSIHVYTELVPSTMYHNVITGNFFLPESSISSSYWHGIMVSTNKTELYCPSFYLTKQEIEEYGDLAYVQKLYPNARISDVSPSYLVIYFSSEKLKTVLEQDVSTHQGASYIINERDSIVSSSDENQVGLYFMSYDTVRGLSSEKNGYTEKTVMEEDVYATSYRLGDSDWYMVTVMPQAPILNRGRDIILNLMLIYFLTLTVALVFALVLSNSLIRRIARINSSMRDAREALPVPLPEPTVHDEIGELTRSYNHMANEINTLMEREKEAAKNLRKTEVRALQAQINPHFLYNTMDMISWMAQTGKGDDVTSAVRALSEFYKLTLSKKDIYADIRSEREHVKLYLKLQNMRYEGKLHLIDDIPDELNDIRIPKLTLQPIVENAVLHGILEKESAEGTILLTAWTEEDHVIILVSDDGVGMDEETKRLILSGNTKNTGGTNIAIVNTHRRLKMLFGEEYGLKYESAPGEGTEVMITLPKETNQS
ncbi:MAG: histidine kinase [Lachnospiraceae bacterium]|nr:histidine kinase [Lachnospiraceae bacterium]